MKIPITYSLSLYLKEIDVFPLLSRQEEIDLSKKTRAGDAGAREKLINSNLRLVVKIAHDYSTFGVHIADLISEGNIGLMKSADRFDPKYGVKFSTYALWWIKQTIKKALANQSKTIRLPCHVVDKLAKIRKVSDELTDTLGREPTDDEIADETGLPSSKVSSMKEAAQPPSNLDFEDGADQSGSGTEGTAGGSTLTLAEKLADENATDPSEFFADKALRADVAEIIHQHLTPRERMIIAARFGLNGQEPQTLEEVGKRFKLTRERIRQLQARALATIKRKLTRLDLPPLSYK